MTTFRLGKIQRRTLIVSAVLASLVGCGGGDNNKPLLKAAAVSSPDQFGAQAANVSRALLIVSDGAAVIDPRVQGTLRAEFARIRPNLYWLFLRTKGSPAIADKPAGEDTPQAAPERHLDQFFKSLGTPYRAFEAEGPEAVAAAIRQIEALERDPIPYTERRPRRDLSWVAFGLALLGLLLLVAGKLAEADVRRGRGGLPQAAEAPSERIAA